MPVQVNQLGGLAHASNCRFLHRFALSCQSDHATIVIGVHFAIEQVYAIKFHRFHDGINFGSVASFGEVGNAFDQRLHKREGYLEGNAAASSGGRAVTFPRQPLSFSQAGDGCW